MFLSDRISAGTNKHVHNQDRIPTFKKGEGLLIGNRGDILIPPSDVAYIRYSTTSTGATLTRGQSVLPPCS